MTTSTLPEPAASKPRARATGKAPAQCPSCKFTIPAAKREASFCPWCNADVHQGPQSDMPEYVQAADVGFQERATGNGPMIVVAAAAIGFFVIWTVVAALS